MLVFVIYDLAVLVLRVISVFFGEAMTNNRPHSLFINRTLIVHGPGEGAALVSLER